MNGAIALQLADEDVEEDAEPEVAAVDPKQPFPHHLLGVRTLWIEVVRRAAFDWVLYKNSQKLSKRQLAQDAYIWLFVEDRDHPDWDERIERDGCAISSFVGICEAMDLDPVAIRRGIHRLTPPKIKALGKLPTRRSRREASEPGSDDIEVRTICGTAAVRFLFEVMTEEPEDEDRAGW